MKRLSSMSSMPLMPPSPTARATVRLIGLAFMVSSLSVLSPSQAQPSGASGPPTLQTTATAVPQPSNPSIYLLPSEQMRRSDASAMTAQSRAGASGVTDTGSFLATGGNGSPRARLVEMPADVIPGQYSRPKYALGFRSQGMKKFANSIGLDAHTCLAPLVRARVNFSQDGDAGGRLMVFARCSLR